jgi:hypothetical protein
MVVLVVEKKEIVVGLRRSKLRRRQRQEDQVVQPQRQEAQVGQPHRQQDQVGK